MLNDATPDQGQRMAELLQQARAADPERVSVRVLGTWFEGGRGLLPDDELDAWMGRFIELGESVLDEVLDSDEAPDFWDLFGLGLVARALVFSPRPRPLRAAVFTEGLLEIDPGCRMASEFLRPFTTEREVLAREAYAGLDWEELAAEPEPDGAVPGLPDAALVSLARTAKACFLRIRLHAPPGERLLGINLLVDADADQATGAPWWGGNTAFTFDRLVTAWVARDESGTWRGAVGVAEAEPAYAGEMTGLGDGTVGFAVERSAPAVVLRVPQEALGGDGVRCVVAVGTNAQWNDDVPDEGSLAFGVDRAR